MSLKKIEGNNSMLSVVIEVEASLLQQLK